METAFNKFCKGLKYFFKGIGFMANNHLLRYLAFPILIIILLAIVGFSFVENLRDFILSLINLNNSDVDFFGKALIVGAIGFMSWLLISLLLAYISGFVALIIMSPILSILSEKTEAILTNKQYETDAEQVVRDVLRGIYIAIRNLVKELLFVILITLSTLLLGWIPGIGQIIAIAGQIFLFLLATYYYGFSFMDYFVERRRVNAKNTILIIKQNKGLAIGNGLVFSLVSMIPFVGSVLSCFVAEFSVVGSTLAMLSEENDESWQLPNVR